MKFSIKVFMCTIIIVAISFSIGAYLLISGNYNSAMYREIKRGLEEHQLLKFAYESALISSEMQGQVLTEDILNEVAGQVVGSTSSEDRFVRLYGSNLNEIYSNFPFKSKEISLLQSLPMGQRKYVIENTEGRFLLTVAGYINLDTISVYFCSSRDISEIFIETDRQIKSFIFLGTLIMVVSAAVMLVISVLLTRPIKKLKITSMQIADGDFSRRVYIRTKDEIGELAVSFNKMANVVEEKVAELERIAEQKEEFVANFTHEIKTPLTTVIGYADMLRSKECDSETTFKAASYIFREGKRLEALSFKLMELLFTENQIVELKEVSVKPLINDIENSLNPLLAENNLILEVSIEDGTFLAECDLIKTLLINLIDNARKASNLGGKIELSGKKDKGSYHFCIKDYGRGIPKEELPKITQAFYMVDKSRARTQHGSGLGLALASKIAAMHGTELVFQSEPGQGTSVCFNLRMSEGGKP
jgi:signal transduction histidine kinase